MWAFRALRRFIETVVCIYLFLVVGDTERHTSNNNNQTTNEPKHNITQPDIKSYCSIENGSACDYIVSLFSSQV